MLVELERGAKAFSMRYRVDLGAFFGVASPASQGTLAAAERWAQESRGTYSPVAAERAPPRGRMLPSDRREGQNLDSVLLSRSQSLAMRLAHLQVRLSWMWSRVISCAHRTPSVAQPESQSISYLCCKGHSISVYKVKGVDVVCSFALMNEPSPHQGI
ncbi:hypothetical protein H920_06925 [Fukomys damarensis]|uniref:Uncharacterized protein n=1 Tax=Fukomys damarensis TaxID=885580 RepID=A0A091E971_FUKDA|nr:hypothetical protein H920_06925 [Fukomys damarensis]